MRTPKSAPWNCPQCGRTVPARQPQCHCGVMWSESPAAHRATDGTDASSGSGGRAVLVLALFAAAGYGLYAAAQKREQSLQAAEAAQQERLRLESKSAAAGAATPAQTPPPAFAPSTYTPPVGGGLGFSSPRAEAAPAPSKVRPKNDESPSPTSMEEAWTRASELLEEPLQKITAETAELQMQYAPFASTCLDAPTGNWLVAMRSGSFVRGGPTYSRFGVTMDCEFARRELVARGNMLKAEMETAERLAHSHSVLPGHWRKLVESHQLDIWDSY